MAQSDGALHKPSLDLLRAIFDESDDESESDESVKDVEEKNQSYNSQQVATEPINEKKLTEKVITVLDLVEDDDTYGLYFLNKFNSFTFYSRPIPSTNN